MIQFGYKMMTEEHGPKELVENARMAEDAGFDFVSISDHFHPWLEAQGHSPFAWSVLGAIAHATSKIAITTGLTCPIIRYHPAIIAQAAATIAVMSDNRFSLAVGAGERLNEHVTGAPWPSVMKRHAMLAEAIDIFRLLWRGEVETFEGDHFTVDHARLYDVPTAPIPVIVGVSGEKSLELAVEKGDGFMTTAPDKSLVQGFKKQKRGDSPFYAEAALAYDEDEDAAQRVLHERFKFSAFDWSVNSEIPAPAGFEAATKFVRPEDLGEMTYGPDVRKHAAGIKKYIDAGYNRIALTGVGPDQAKFIHFFKTELRPALEQML